MRRFVPLILVAAIPLSSFAAGAGAPAEPPRSGVVEAGAPTAPPAGPGAGEAVGDNVNVSDDPARPQNETSIAVDPADPLNLVAGANDYRYGDSDAGVAVSFDGGESWSADTLDGLDDLLGKYDAQGDPAVAAYRGGIFYLAFIDFNRGDDQNRLGVAKSFDGGTTWPQLGVIVDHPGPGAHDFEDKEYIAVDDSGGPFDGNVYVTWTRFPVVGGTTIRFTRSTDGGLTFSPPAQISDFVGGYQGSIPAVGPAGEIYVAWVRNAQVQFDRSIDGGLTWGADVLVANQDPIPSPLPGALFRNNSFPSLAVDRSGGPGHGNLYVVWNDESVSGQGPDVVLSRSTDGGSTWSPPRRVSDDTNREFQWFPWIAVDAAGAVHVVFFDRRDDPGSARFHTYYARSADGALTFGPNVRVSDAVSDAAFDGFDGTFIGDYNGIAASAVGAHPLWTDVRPANANAEAYTTLVDAGPLLGARGACPGGISLLLTGATPLAEVAIARGSGPGSTTIPDGPCAGVVLDLAGAGLLGIVSADADGAVVIRRDVPAAACGLGVQALDLESCLASNVAVLP